MVQCPELVPSPADAADRVVGTKRQDCATFEHSLRLWLSTGGPIVSQSELSMGPLLSSLGRHIRQFLEERGTPRVETRSVAWLLDIDQPARPLEPHTDPGYVRTVVFPVAEVQVSLGTLWQWRRRRAETLWFFADGAWHEVDPEAALARRLFRRLFWPLVRLVSPGTGLDVERAEKTLMTWAAGRRQPFKIPEIRYESALRDGEDCWVNFIAADNARLDERPGMPMDRPLRVTQYIGSLYAGGAERQLCNLTLGLAEKKLSVRVLTTHEVRGGGGHYEHLLARRKIEARPARGRQQLIMDMSAGHRQLLRALPSDERNLVIRLASELTAEPPDLLQCWLDEPNIIGGLAGLYAGVPRILLSFRNLNPTHVPRLLKPHTRAWYKLMAQSERVHFLANSHGGAASYAAWLGIPEQRIHVVFNGMCFDHFPEPTPANRVRARWALGLQRDQPVLVGVFRLDEEKQPQRFLEVARRVQGAVRNVHVLIAGSGPLEADVRDFIDRHQMGGYVSLLGRRQNIGQVYLAGDVLLLASAVEGCPNVALEAQYLGLPVVATDAGGTRDAMVPGRTGFLADPDDTEEMVERVVQLLMQPELRSAMAACGRPFIQDQYHVQQMVDLTTQVYQRAFSGDRHSPPIVTPPPAWLRRAENTTAR